jgi:hypothetical protein
MSGGNITGGVAGVCGGLIGGGAGADDDPSPPQLPSAAQAATTPAQSMGRCGIGILGMESGIVREADRTGE